MFKRLRRRWKMLRFVDNHKMIKKKELLLLQRLIKGHLLNFALIHISPPAAKDLESLVR